MQEHIQKLTALSSLTLQLIDIEVQKKGSEAKLADVISQIQKVQADITAFETKHRELQLKIREKELVLKGEIERLHKAQARTHVVKKNEEYKASMKEVATHQKEQATLEEILVTLMTAVEESQKNLSALKEALATLEETRIQTEKEVLSEMTELGNSERTISTEVSTLEATIPAELIQKYNTLKKRVAAPLIVAVESGTCQGCFMGIPPQTINTIRRNEAILSCPNCYRLIYLK